MNEILIGFDIRFTSNDFSRRRWSLKTREQFLLNSDVIEPRSVDPSAWPSRWRDSSQTDLSGVIISIPAESLSMHWLNFHVWDDLGEMVSRYRAPSQMSNYTETAIAISVPVAGNLLKELRGKNFNTDAWNAMTMTVKKPENVGSSWKCIGYDVATLGWLSALTNIGWKLEEMKNFRARYKQSLNEHGIFASLTEATMFAMDATNIATEDGPFYPFHLWQIR
jgi:hypothetical protein